METAFMGIRNQEASGFGGFVFGFGFGFFGFFFSDCN